MTDEPETVDVRCVECDRGMRWGTEYYDENGDPVCPDHR